MIELTNIKATDTVGQLRGQINTMQNEIMADQPMIGACINPSVDLYNRNTLVSSVTAQNVTNYLNAVILPENNGCFVLGFTGVIQFRSLATEAPVVDRISIDIPAIKAVNASASYTSFLTPDHLGLKHQVVGTEYFRYINCQYRHVTETGQATVPLYVAYINTSKNSPGTLNIELLFDKGNLDFTNGAAGFIAF
jgi:hypothetical protein|nr:MAG TPA_asm: hypothetical protein [Caudoviricetes sp.]